MSYIQRLANVSFNNYALIEFIIDRINISKGTLEIESNIEPTNVYVAKMRSKTFDDSSGDYVTFFEECEFSYTAGIIRVDVTSNNKDLELYDKVRFIIHSNGDFFLKNPVFKDYDGRKKELFKDDIIKELERKFGEELNSNTAFPISSSGWRLSQSGASIKALPEEIANYTSYNNVKSHLELSDDEGYAIKDIDINGTNKVAVRIVACMFPKIATTRFNGTDLQETEYTTETVQIRQFDYDYGTLIVDINDIIHKEILVYQGWCEFYFELDTLDLSTLSVKISRKCFVDDSYINHTWPMFIHDVSIQKIG